MKTQKIKKCMSLFLAALMCVTTLFGIGTTAYAAEETDEVCLVSFPRDGDANYGGEWGHGSYTYANGWSMASSRYTTVRAMGSYDGNICYCIEPGVPQDSGDRFTKKGENFWDNYPSSYNSTISPDDIKLFIGRIFQYGYGRITATNPDPVILSFLIGTTKARQARRTENPTMSVLLRKSRTVSSIPWRAIPAIAAERTAMP